MPQGLSKNGEFISDLKMEKTAWVYADNRRILLAMKEKDKEDAEKSAIIKKWRDIGVATTVGLQEKKSDFGLCLFTIKAAADQECFGNFINAALLANYHYCHLKESDLPKEGEDPRLKRKTKTIDHLNFQDEHDTVFQPEPYFQMVSAHATITARNLANYRGSYGDPDKIHEVILRICKTNKGKNIKEIRILEAQ